MRIVLTGGSAEITEKKSRFIARVRAVSSPEEAYAYLADVRKTCWDARHNCHAYVIGPYNEAAHSSDDGEPQGTAGKPILQVLTGSGVHNCIIVVTRYFGGVLLGTGGLVHAYTETAKAGLAASVLADEEEGVLLTVCCGYEQLGRVQYVTASLGIPSVRTSYTDCCSMDLLVPSGQLPALRADLTEKTAGHITFPEEKPVRFIRTADGEIRQVEPL